MSGFRIGGDSGRYISYAPRRMLFSRRWFIAAGLALLALLAGGIDVCASETPEAGAVESRVEEFLTLTSSGDYSAAFDLLSETAQRESFQSFRIRMSGDPRFSSISEVKPASVRVAGPESSDYVYEGRVVYDDGSERKLHATLVHSVDQWLISSIEIE